MDFRLGETCFVKQLFQILRRIGCHALHYIRPLGIAIHHFYQDGELTARLQYTAHLLQAIRQIGPEINGLYSRYEVELPIFVR